MKADQRTDISVKEVPQSNPMDVLLGSSIQKQAKQSRRAQHPLKVQSSKVEFYATFSEPRSAKAKAGADRTWIFKTDAEGKVRFTEDYLVSGDDFYYQSDGETPCLPLGKYYNRDESLRRVSSERRSIHSIYHISRCEGDG
ncbi:MAG: hypothetical protein V8Q42_12775 [Anaerovoracaceae bacterium]